MLVEDAVAAGLEVKEVYLRDGDEMPACVRVVPHVLDAHTFDSVNDTVTPQGVLAVCTIPAPGPVRTGADDWYVVAHGLSDPGNLGTVIRSAEAAGATGVVVTPGTVDVWSPKTVRATAGGVFRVPVHHVAGLADLRAMGVRLIGTTSHDASTSMYQADFTGCVGLVLGNEAYGLEASDPVDDWVSIPHAGRAESLNVAMAASILSLHAAHVRSQS